MEEHLLKVRLQKIEDLRQAGVNPYANGFAPTHTASDVAAGDSPHGLNYKRSNMSHCRL